MRRVAGILVSGIFVLEACGGPTTPSPSNLAGNWSGTLASSTFATVPITMTLAQSGFSVTGAWTSTLPGWNGTVSGLADTDSFTGEVSVPSSLELGGPGTSGHCMGTAMVNGSATAASIHWATYGGKYSCRDVDDTQLIGVAVELTLHR